ncbi:ATP-binding protein [Lachnoclostridium sp. Marseille-P6806]|uniref:ATP-binding protein n=1 Tax=Lachnoclostridium sp. Marseille-P6806 TaxID=2364793 RepID=UPI003FA5E4F2
MELSRFYRRDTAHSSNGSYGLGLALLDAIIRQHRGKVSVECKEGKNTFCVELPVL